jgi:alkylation response protein AidB-like acyl-CoA dehydrogenase
VDFDFTDEQRAITSTARELLARRADDERLWEEICELGWAGIAVGEEHGGQGLSVVELSLLAEQLGYACAPTPFLGTTLAALALEHAGSEVQRSRWLPRLAVGETLGAAADGPGLIPDAVTDALLVLFDREAGSATLHAAGAVEAVEAIDPRRRHGRLVPALGAGEPLEGDVAGALDRALVVVAAELVGLCRRALDLTLAHVKDRKQFGVPVGSFQAVQHAAAQMLRDTEAAAVATYYAAWTADAEPASLPAAAAMAKGTPSDAGRAVTAAAIQLHGGIGFTWEADVHWLFKRAQIDAAYLGGPARHRARLAELVAADRAWSRRIPVSQRS